MAAEEILGISGQMDISDIQDSFNKLCDGLNRVGVDAEALSQRMTKALNNIAQSDGDMVSKTQQAMQVLKSVMDEAAKGIQQVPEMIEAANKRVDTIRGTIGKLSEQLTQTKGDASAFREISKQIEIQKQSLQLSQDDAKALAVAYDEVRNAISLVSGAYQALEAVSIASTATNTMDAAASEANTVAKTANSVASAANATGTLAEGLAHAENATKIGQETEAVAQNTKARQQQQETLSAEVQMFDRLTESLKDGNLSEEQYQRIIEQETAALERQRIALNELSQQRDEHNSHPIGNGYEFDAQGNITNSADVETWQAETKAINQQYEAQKKIIEETETALKGFIEAHDSLAKSQGAAANATQKTQEANSQEIKSYEQLTAEVNILETKIAKLQQRKQELLSLGAGISIPVVPADALVNSGITFGSEKLENLRSVNQQLEATKEKLDEANAKLQEFQQIGQESGKASFANYAEELQNISFAIDETKKRLADYENQYDKLANKDNLTAKQKQELEVLAQKINDTKKGLLELKGQLQEKNEETFIGKLRDKLSDTSQKISEFGERVKNGILTPINNLEEKISGSSFGQRFSAEFTQAKAGLDDFKNGVVNVITANGKFQAQVDVIGEAFKGLGIPISGSLNAIKSVTKALWAMCATPIGAVVAAIALAFKAVHTWMTKSSEGQMVYTKLMAYFGSLAKSVTDIIVILGSYIYHCFADNNGPLRDFGNNFVKTFKTAVTAAINLISGLGTTIKGVFNMDWDTFTDGLKKTWDGIKGTGETVINAFKTSVTATTGALKAVYTGFTDDKLGKDLSATFNSIFDKASAAASLAGNIQQAQIAIKKHTEEQLVLDKQIAEQRNKIYTLQGQEKIAAIETTKALIKQKYDKQIEQQQRLAELSAKNAKLHTQSLADIAAERELRKDILKTQIQQSSEQRMLVRQEEAAKRANNNKSSQSAKKEAKQDAQITSAEGKLDEVEYKNEYARLQAMQDLEQKIADVKIEALEEGEEKVLAQRNRQLQKEIEQIEKEKEAAVKAERDRQKAEFDARQDIIKARGGKTRSWDEKTDLDTTQITKITSRYDEYATYKVQASNQEEVKRLKTITDKYKDENQKRIDLEKQYDEDIKKIQEARIDKEKELNKASTEEQKKELQKQIDNLILAEAQARKDKGEAIVEFDFKQLKKNPEYVAAFEDLNNVSTETLNNLIELFDKYKDKAAEAMSPDQLREYTNTLQQMQDELLGRENPFKQVAAVKVEYQVSNEQVSALEKYIKALKTGKGIAEAANNVEKKLGKTYKTREEAEKALAKAKDKRNKKENKYLKSVKNLNEKINELASSITDLGNTIGGTEGQILGLIGSVLTFVTQTSDGIKAVAATGAQAISTIEKASVILTIISAAIQLLQKMSSLYKDSHAQYEEYAEEIQQVNNLTNAVNEYRLAALAANQAKEKWFATTDLTDLKDAYTYSQNALESYMETATQAQATYQNEKAGGWLTNALKWLGSMVGKAVSLPGKLVSAGLEAMGVNMDSWIGNIAKWGVDGAFGGVEALIGKGIGSVIDNSDNYSKGTTAAINNLRIETRAKTKGFLGTGIGAKSQKTQDLQSWVKEKYGEDLFDENYLINVELANKVIEAQGDKLVGETKETLEELIKFREEYDKFNEQVEEYVSDAFSPLTDNLTDALFDWLDTGEDVMDKFKEYASETFQDIAKEIVKTAITDNLFSTFKDKVKELYKAYSIGGMDEKQLSSGIKQATEQLMKDAETQLPMLQDMLKYLDDQFSQIGIDLAGASQSEQSATSKAIEAITEDQASSLIGIGYAMQIATEQGNEMRTQIAIDVSSMRTFSEQTANNISEMRDIQYQGLEQLEAINKNTAPIIFIREDIASMYKLMKDRY